MFQFDIDELRKRLLKELDYREKKQNELDEINRKIKILGRILEYKGNRKVSKLFQYDGLNKLQRLFHKKTSPKLFDMQEWGFDIAHFSNRVKNLTDQQREEFYKIAFGKVHESVPSNFIRDIQEYKRLSMKYNLSQLEIMKQRKYFVNVAASLSMMFESYHQLQNRRNKLQEEVLGLPMIGQLKRVLRKLEHQNQFCITEKDRQILTTFLTSSKREKRKIEALIENYNANWLQKQEEKKETLKKIKSLEIKNCTICKENITLVKDDMILDEVINLEEEEHENQYVTHLFELLRLEPNLENIKEYLPTIEFQDYYFIRDELLDKVAYEINLLKEVKKETKVEEERSYIAEEITQIKEIYDYLVTYFKEYEKEEQQELQMQCMEHENKLIYLTNNNGQSYFMKDIKNDLEKEQIPYLLKALQRVKYGMIDFDTRKLNKLKDGKGFLGADDIFEAKAGQVRILFQYLGENKIAILMYFNKKSNRTTTLLHETMKERITNCQDQVLKLRTMIKDGTFQSERLEQSKVEEDHLADYFISQNKTLKTKCYQLLK